MYCVCVSACAHAREREKEWVDEYLSGQTSGFPGGSGAPSPMPLDHRAPTPHLVLSSTIKIIGSHVAANMCVCLKIFLFCLFFGWAGSSPVARSAETTF